MCSSLSSAFIKKTKFENQNNTHTFFLLDFNYFKREIVRESMGNFGVEYNIFQIIPMFNRCPSLVANFATKQKSISNSQNSNQFRRCQNDQFKGIAFILGHFRFSPFFFVFNQIDLIFNVTRDIGQLLSEQNKYKMQILFAQ